MGGWPLGYLHIVVKELNSRLPRTNPDRDRMEDSSQGPPDFKFSPLNHLATLSPLNWLTDYTFPGLHVCLVQVNMYMNCNQWSSQIHMQIKQLWNLSLKKTFSCNNFTAANVAYITAMITDVFMCLLLQIVLLLSLSLPSVLLLLLFININIIICIIV